MLCTQVTNMSTFWYRFARLCVKRHHSLRANSKHAYICWCIITDPNDGQLKVIHVNTNLFRHFYEYFM